MGSLAFIMLLPNLWISYPLLGCGSIFCFFALLFGANLILSFINRAQLVTTPDGIKFHTPGYTISSQWANIDRIEMIRFGFWSVESLILRQPNIQPSKWWAWLRMRGIEGNNIPVTLFLEEWRCLELGQYLKQHIVLKGEDLQMDTNEQSAKDAREAKLSKIQETQSNVRKIVFIVVGVFLIIICLWGFITTLLQQ